MISVGFAVRAGPLFAWNFKKIIFLTRSWVLATAVRWRRGGGYVKCTRFGRKYNNNDSRSGSRDLWLATVAPRWQTVTVTDVRSSRHRAYNLSCKIHAYIMCCDMYKIYYILCILGNVSFFSLFKYYIVFEVRILFFATRDRRLARWAKLDTGFIIIIYFWFVPQ